MASRKPYPSDVSDEEWVFVAPFLALVREDAPQRNHDLREVFNGLRWIVRTGSAWRYMPHDLPPWEAVYQQTRRWLEAGVFKQMVHDLRVLLRLSENRAPDPTATILDFRTLQCTPESGSWVATTGRSARRVRVGRWLGTKRPNGASCSSGAAGSWSEFSQGHRVFAGWQKSMRGAPPLW